MVYFPNDNAHCKGEGCDARGGCLRYVALQYKGSSATRVVMVSPDPKDCPLFVEVRKDEMVLSAASQSPRSASAKVRRAVSAVSIAGGATAKR